MKKCSEWHFEYCGARIVLVRAGVVRVVGTYLRSITVISSPPAIAY